MPKSFIYHHNTVYWTDMEPVPASRLSDDGQQDPEDPAGPGLTVLWTDLEPVPASGLSDDGQQGHEDPGGAGDDAGHGVVQTLQQVTHDRKVKVRCNVMHDCGQVVSDAVPMGLLRQLFLI